MAATITNPGTVGSYAAYPSATQTFLQTLIETPWSGWSIAQVQALLETCARLSGGANPQARHWIVAGRDSEWYSIGVQSAGGRGKIQPGPDAFGPIGDLCRTPANDHCQSGRSVA